VYVPAVGIDVGGHPCQSAVDILWIERIYESIIHEICRNNFYSTNTLVQSYKLFQYIMEYCIPYESIIHEICRNNFYSTNTLVQSHKLFQNIME